MKFKPQLFKTIAFLQLLLLSSVMHAQSAEMADVMRSNGKIYVVVAVIAIIFTGIVIYLISIDRKVGKIENEIEDLKK